MRVGSLLPLPLLLLLPLQKKARLIQAHHDNLAWMARVPEAPTYRPTAEQWQDPLAYIRSIQPEAAQYGVCAIVAPVTSAVPAGLVGALPGALAARGCCGALWLRVGAASGRCGCMWELPGGVAG